MEVQTASPSNEVRLWRGQARLLQDTEKRHHAVVAGNRYGKTHFGAEWVVTRAILNRYSKQILVVAPTHSLLKQVNFPAVLAVLDRARIPYKANLGDLVITLPWGVRLLFLSAETHRRLVGYTAAAYWLDEPGICPEEIERELAKRLSCPNAVVRQGLHTGTPEGINHFAKMFGMGAVTRESPLHSVSETKIVLHGRTYDNPLLDPSYVQELLDAFGWNDNLRRAYIEGEFVPLFENNCFEFLADRDVTDLKADPELGRLTLTFDFNVGLVTWSALQEIKGKHFLVAENERRCRDTDQACDQFIKLLPPQLWAGCEIVVTGDCNGWARDTRSSSNDYDIIKNRLRPLYPRLKIVAPTSNPSVTASIVATNRLLVKEILKVNRQCAGAIESLQTTVFDGKGGIKKPQGDTWTHRSDGLRYYVEEVAPIKSRVNMGITW